VLDVGILLKTLLQFLFLGLSLSKGGIHVLNLPVSSVKHFLGLLKLQFLLIDHALSSLCSGLLTFQALLDSLVVNDQLFFLLLDIELELLHLVEVLLECLVIHSEFSTLLLKMLNLAPVTSALAISIMDKLIASFNSPPQLLILCFALLVEHLEFLVLSIISNAFFKVNSSSQCVRIRRLDCFCG
jgi:hypothetical protein